MQQFAKRNIFSGLVVQLHKEVYRESLRGLKRTYIALGFRMVQYLVMEF